MSKKVVDAVEAAVDLLRRKRAQTSLHSFALNINIPGAPFDAMKPDEDLLGPARDLMALHHAIICDRLQITMNTPFGRQMIFAPPGSAKSSYASVIAPAWEMGRRPKSRLILASYADKIAKKQSRRAIQICRSNNYEMLWDTPVSLERDAADDWSLSNESEFMAAGIMGGITGNRASGVIIDDPVAGREEADSELVRQKTLDGYQDDVLTRLLPGAWIVFIMTRWNMSDLAGSILPDNYDGRTGYVRCKDGMDWHILNIPAKAERPDDPLGRELGEYLWTDWFPPRHWQMFENAEGREARRVWASLYQQRPAPEEAGDIQRDKLNWYNLGEEPPMETLALIGASDYAVTEKGGDFSEHGLWGMDPVGDLWALKWWSGQQTTDVSIDAFLDIVADVRQPNVVRMWFNEGGVIDKAVRPAINKRMRERKTYVDLRALSSMKDKRSKVSSFIARANAGHVWLPKVAWAYDLVDQIATMTSGGRFDDKADVAGLIGRAVDQFREIRPAQIEKKQGIKPFTAAWLEYDDSDQMPKVRYK
jgi:predicted phage terminase large subunit-like protein